MPKNRQHYRKIKYPDKVTKQKRLVFVRIFLFSSLGSRNAYFPTASFYFKHNIKLYHFINRLFAINAIPPNISTSITTQSNSDKY